MGKIFFDIFDPRGVPRCPPISQPRVKILEIASMRPLFSKKKTIYAKFGVPTMIMVGCRGGGYRF